MKVARSAPRSIPSGGDARDGREPRKRTASDVFAPSAGAGPSTPSPAKKKAKKRASGARAPVGERKVKGKRSVAADGKKRLVDEDLANCYAAMHSCTDLGDVEQCETMRKYFCSMASQFANPYNWWHEVVPCAARDSKRPIEVLTWALERGAPLDPKAALSACERAPHPLRTTAEGVYTSAVDVLLFLHKRNCTIDEDTLYCAAEFGELDCLKYMIEQVGSLSNNHRIFTPLKYVLTGKPHTFANARLSPPHFSRTNHSHVSLVRVSNHTTASQHGVPSLRLHAIVVSR